MHGGQSFYKYFGDPSREVLLPIPQRPPTPTYSFPVTFCKDNAARHIASRRVLESERAEQGERGAHDFSVFVVVSINQKGFSSQRNWDAVGMGMGMAAAVPRGSGGPRGVNRSRAC
jgi:hypothetical protein